MEKVLLSLFVTTTIFLSIEMASVEVLSTPTKVAVSKPRPFERDLKFSPADSDSSTKTFNSKNSTDLNIDKKNINNTAKGNDSSEHPEIKNWPKVFVLKPDPTNPVICYAGSSININKNNHSDLEISSLKEAQTDGSESSVRSTKKFVLSSDPLYPVICQEVNIAAQTIYNGTEAKENATTLNVTCIRRDYEKNISAIFINQAGPIQSAFNIFNSTIPYGFFNIANVTSLGEITMLNETIVDCVQYGITDGEKGLSTGAINSLLGG